MARQLRPYLAPLVAWCGVIVSLLLAIQHIRRGSSFCSSAAGCEAGIERTFGTVHGIPLSFIGEATWALLLIGLTASLFLDASPFKTRLLSLLRVIIFLGALFSAGLVGIRAFKLHAYCPLCLASAGCFFFLALLLAVPMRAEQRLLPMEMAPALGLAMLATIASFAWLVWNMTAPEVPKSLATINGATITDDDLPISVRLAIQPLEEDAAKLRRDWLDQRLDELALENEAKRQHIAPKDLLARQTASASKVTDADLTAWRDQHKDELNQSNEDVIAKVKLSKESNAEDKYLAQLRSEQRAAILVRAPIPPVVHFDLEHAEIDGPRNAPTVFVVFSDFECPFCRQLAANLREARRQLGNKAATVYKHLPLDAIHPKARAFALASIAADEQGKFWPYHDALIAKEIASDDTALTDLAKSLGLDAAKFTDALHSQRVADHLAADVKEAESLGLEQTPTLFVNGTLRTGLPSAEDLVKTAGGVHD